MKTTRFFEPSRFLLLLNMELFRSKKGLLVTFVISFGLLFTGFILENIFGTAKVFDSHAANYTFFLLAGGFILSSMAFSDLGNQQKRYNYLLLPASAFEKFLCMWLLSSLGWILFYTITYILYTLIANSAGHILFRGMTFIPFQPFGKTALHAMRYYIILQSVFLVAAVHFKGYVFPKTLFTIILFAMLCAFICYIIMSDLISSDLECRAEFSPFNNAGLKQILNIAWFVFLWILAPVNWVITYIGLKDQEA